MLESRHTLALPPENLAQYSHPSIRCKQSLDCMRCTGPFKRQPCLFLLSSYCSSEEASRSLSPFFPLSLSFSLSPFPPLYPSVNEFRTPTLSARCVCLSPAVGTTKGPTSQGNHNSSFSFRLHSIISHRQLGKFIVSGTNPLLLSGRHVQLDGCQFPQGCKCHCCTYAMLDIGIRCYYSWVGALIDFSIRNLNDSLQNNVSQSSVRRPSHQNQINSSKSCVQSVWCLQKQGLTFFSRGHQGQWK